MRALTQRIADKLLRKAGLFSAFNRNTHINVAGRTFLVPTIHGNRAEPSEAWMVEVLRRLLALRKGPVIDVGVNLGQTLLKIKAIDPSREYVGFEPNATCVNYVEKLLQANGLQNCTVLPVGLAREAGILTLDLFGCDADSGASLIPNFRPNDTVTGNKSVAVMSLKELPSGTIPEGVALLKIDVEGAELSVLEALLSVIERDRPFIVMEILPTTHPSGLIELIARRKSRNIFGA